METAKLGLKANWKQFLLLVIVNGFVGGMVGLERSILPKLAEEEFGLIVHTAILTFIVVFGTVKAISNYYAGAFANKIGRKNLLIIGWLFGIPVPFILMFAPSWSWIIVANVFLGINQGLAWSSTVVMKIDLVGEKNRGFAMGINEFAGYLSIAIVALATGWIADNYGIRPYPFYLGIAFVFIGLLLSIFLIKDTRNFIKQESISNKIPQLKNIFKEVTYKHKNISSVTQAGLVNNLNDGMIWGILPILLFSKGFDLGQIGIVVATYPAVWGISQLFTGGMGDKLNKQNLMTVGMTLQALAIIPMVWADSMLQFIILTAILGWGTAMVYPTFMATIADLTNPLDRAKGIGIFRFWRDLGYAVGAILTGVISDLFNIETAIALIAGLTLISAMIVHFRMDLRKR